MPVTIWERGQTFRSREGFGFVIDNEGRSVIIRWLGRFTYSIAKRQVPHDAIHEEDLRIPSDIKMAFDAIRLLTSNMTLLGRDISVTSENFVMKR